MPITLEMRTATRLVAEILISFFALAPEFVEDFVACRALKIGKVNIPQRII